MAVVVEHLVFDFERGKRVAPQVVFATYAEVEADAVAVVGFDIGFAALFGLVGEAPVGVGQTSEGIEAELVAQIDHIVHIGVDAPHREVVALEEVVDAGLEANIVGGEILAFDADAEVFNLPDVVEVQATGFAVLLRRNAEGAEGDGEEE